MIGTRRLRSGEVQPWPRNAVGMLPADLEGDLEAVPMLVGGSCGAVTDIKPAAAIVRDLVRDTEVLVPWPE